MGHKKRIDANEIVKKLGLSTDWATKIASSSEKPKNL